jgi:photosystem II stability/assembly factor-like uncharacterized protein
MGGKSSLKALAVFFCVLFSSSLLCQEDDIAVRRPRFPGNFGFDSLRVDRPPQTSPQMENGDYPMRFVNDFVGDFAGDSLARALDPESWQSFGPMGGNVVSLKANPLNLDEVYALVYCSYSLSCVYKSTNAGKNWIRTAILDKGCYDMALHPQDPKILFALSSHAVFKSTDGGTNWTQHSLGFRNYGYDGQIVIDPINPDTLHAAGYHYYSSSNYCMAAFKSTDGGANWKAEYIQPDSLSGQACCIAVNPSSPNVLYLGGYFKEGYYTRYRVYKSKDSGESWQDTTGTIGGYPRSIVIDPSNPSKVLVGTNWGVYRSSDGGQTWEIGGRSACAYALGMDPSNPGTIYAGYNSKCFKSTDGGANWTEYAAGLNGNCQDILVRSGCVYYGSYVGIHRSLDGGMTWESSNSGIKNNVIPAIAVAGGSPNVIYAEAAQNGLFKSTDFGNSWSRLPDFYRCESIFSICVSSANPDELVLLAGG